MSYKYEKTESGTDIVISGWENGIADTPLFGHGEMVNVDIFTQKGLVQAQYASKKVSGTNVTGLVKWFVQNPITGEIYALDNNGVVYVKSTSWGVLSGNTTTAASGNGLALYVSQKEPTKQFLFVARNNKLDVYNIATTTWTNDWKTFSSSTFWNRPMFNSSNARLYIGNVNFIASFQETIGSTFVPATAATYNWNDNALDLPAQYIVTTLKQLGENLIIGTAVGYANYQALNSADIFLWDRESDTFVRPVSLKTNGIRQILVIKNMLVVMAGTAADYYQTNTSYAEDLLKLENIDFNSSGLVTDNYPGAIDNLSNSEIITGISNIVLGLNPLGVYCIRDGKYVCRNLISTGEKGDNAILQIGSVFVFDRNKYHIGWRSGSTYGIDTVNDDGDRYSDYSAYVETDLIAANNNYFPQTFSEVEIRLAENMATNQGIRISWRGGLSDSWSTPVEFSYAVTGATNTYALPIDINDVKNFQLKIEIKAYQSNSPKLWQVRVR